MKRAILFLSTVLLCFTFLVPVLAQTRTLTQQLTPVAPITRSNDPQYAIAFDTQNVNAIDNVAFIDHTPIRLGETGQLTVEIEFYPRGSEGCIWSYGTPTTDSYFSLQVVQNGKLRLRNGAWNLPNYETITSQVVLPTLNTWYTISVTLANENSTSPTFATAQIYVNGQLVHTGRVRPLVNAIRGGFIGSCQYTTRWDRVLQQPIGLYGAVAAYQLWGIVRSAAQIKEFYELMARQVAVSDTTGLFFRTFFREGFGTTISVQPGPLLTSYFVLTIRTARWVVRDRGELWRQCKSTGDPHVRFTLPDGTNVAYDPPHKPGYFILTSCGPDIEVRTYHSWWRFQGDATINYGVTMLFFGDVWYLDQQGNLFFKTLGQPFVSISYVCLRCGLSNTNLIVYLYIYILSTSYLSLSLPPFLILTHSLTHSLELPKTELNTNDDSVKCCRECVANNSTF
jgi:hypothetical protein